MTVIICFFIYFSSLLNLVKVTGINICSRKMMHAITTLCPNLKHVKITGRLRHLPLEDVLSIKELQFLLSSSMASFWYKVKLTPNNCFLLTCINNSDQLIFRWKA